MGGYKEGIATESFADDGARLHTKSSQQAPQPVQQAQSSQALQRCRSGGSLGGRYGKQGCGVCALQRITM
jgi:hypothetical protein